MLGPTHRQYPAIAIRFCAEGSCDGQRLLPSLPKRPVLDDCARDVHPQNDRDRSNIVGTPNLQNMSCDVLLGRGQDHTKCQALLRQTNSAL